MGGLAHFQLSGVAKGLDVAPPAGEQAAFERGDIEVTLEFRLSDAGRETADCQIIARTVREVSSEVFGLLEEPFERHLEKSMTPEREIGSPVALAFASMAWMVKPPEPLVLVCEDVYAELHSEASRLVQILRWLFNRPGPARPLGRAQLAWSLDGERWVTAPTRLEDAPYWYSEPENRLTASGAEMVRGVWQ